MGPEKDLASRAASILRGPRLPRQLWQAMGRPECFLTGGWVRDRLLGRPTADLDLIIPGSQGRAERLARRLERAVGGRAHLLGEPPRAVWRLQGETLRVELWALAGSSLEEDARRRDFTVNSLMWRLPSGPLLDLAGGLEDLAEGRLRASSRESLSRDPVRLVRGVRLLAQVPGLRLEPSTEVLARELAPSLRSVAGERLGYELRRLLDAPGAAAGLQWLLALRQLEPMAPPGADPDPEWLGRSLGAAALLASPRQHPVPGAVRACGHGARLALLVRAWRCQTPGSLARFAWPRQARSDAWRAATLMDRALEVAHLDAAERRELIHVAGEHFPAVVATAAAVAVTGGCAPEPWRRWWRLWRRCRDELLSPRPLLSAHEVATLVGVSPGPELGHHLRRLLRAQVRGEVRTANAARRFLISKAH